MWDYPSQVVLFMSNLINFFFNFYLKYYSVFYDVFAHHMDMIV